MNILYSSQPFSSSILFTLPGSCRFKARVGGLRISSAFAEGGAAELCRKDAEMLLQSKFPN
jgi:hypothetical protein